MAQGEDEVRKSNRKSTVMKLILGEGTVLVAVGLLIGFATSLAVASSIPARRATRIDPIRNPAQ